MLAQLLALPRGTAQGILATVQLRDLPQKLWAQPQGNSSHDAEEHYARLLVRARSLPVVERLLDRVLSVL